MDKWIKQGGVDLWTESFGDSKDPAVLLMIGAGAISHFYSDAFCQKIAERNFFVIRYDHRDYGKSTHFPQIASEVLGDPKQLQKQLPYRIENLVEDALQILKGYGISKAHLVGHSMGGLIAQLFIAQFPEKALTFTSISAGPATHRYVLEPIHVGFLERLLENKPCGNLEKDMEGWLKSFRLLTGKIPFDEALARKYIQEMYARDPHPGVAWNHIGIQQLMPDYFEAFQKNPIPGLVLHGEEDPLQPVSWASKVHEMIAKTRLEVLPKVGHMFFNPQAQAQVLAHVLKQITKIKEE